MLHTPTLYLQATYDHMLCYLPCARDTLVKRCRRLIVQHQRDLEDEPIRLLKKGIVMVMMFLHKIKLFA